ncbi:MAG: type II toxin-antitoxin system death-on-curing family toxin [Patescibacteria group bacterium]|nr:type II toxin-antitoxin system death-on-curing family toxin [Patescibacteria group bacterium]
MKHLSVSDVVELHDRYVEMFGGTLGIRDDNLLDSAVFRCQASFGGEDLYVTIFEKAAALLHGIIFDHPFVDGNKRAALFSADRLLFLNGYKFSATNDEAANFPLFVERTRPEIAEIASWFKKHCQKIKK